MTFLQQNQVLVRYIATDAYLHNSLSHPVYLTLYIILCNFQINLQHWDFLIKPIYCLIIIHDDSAVILRPRIMSFVCDSSTS